MRRFATSIGLLCLLALAGCGPESAHIYARHAVDPPRCGAAITALTGSADSLIEAGRIDHHRRLAMPDGAAIDVWALNARCLQPGQPARGTVVLLHGRSDCKARLLPLAELLAEHRWDAVLIDQRAHGRSADSLSTFGAREKHDVRRVMDALLAEKLVSDRVYAFGESMGATTAILYADVDPRVRGVLAVAPYTDMSAVCRRFVPLLPEETFRAALAEAGKLADFDPAETSALAAASRLKCPLYVVHGRLDAIVPFSHGQAIHRAAPEPKKFFDIPWAGHLSVALARDRWFAEKLAELSELTPETAQAP